MNPPRLLLDVKTITAIAGLWKLALVALLIVALVVFRKQIRTVLDRLSHFRFNWGKAGIAINEPDLEREIQQAVEKMDTAMTDRVVSAEKPKDAAVESQPSKESSSATKNWEVEMVMSFFDEDREKAKDAYEKLQAGETDEEKRIENEATYLYWSFQKGEASAQGKLQRLESSASQFPDAHATVVRLDAWCYRFAHDLTRAVARFKEAAAVAKKPVMQAQNTRDAAWTLAKLDQRIEAEKLLISGLNQCENNEARVVLLLGLAELYESESMEKKALLLEKALSYQPVDKGRQADTGYAYAEAGLNGLAAMHYQKSLDIGAKQEAATNNLGVSLQNLKLPIRAVSNYKRSIELGGTLAAANFASLLMDAGAAQEAEAVLRAAREKDNAHQNVFLKSNRLRNLQSSEDEQAKKIRKAAEKHQQFLLNYVDAMLQVDSLIPAEGDWNTTYGDGGSMKINNTELEATWIEKDAEFSSKRRYRFRGKVSGKVVAGLIERSRSFYGKPDADVDKLARYGRGHAYFQADKLLLGAVNDGEDEFKELIFVREIKTTVPS